MGSNPIRVASLIHRYSCESMVFNGILAQLGEHLPYKQRVIGSSPIGPILASLSDAAVAEQADAQDLKSCGTNLPCRFDSGLRHCGFDKRALVAQLVEQRTENPRVTGSIPVQGI